MISVGQFGLSGQNLLRDAIVINMLWNYVTDEFLVSITDCYYS